MSALALPDVMRSVGVVGALPAQPLACGRPFIGSKESRRSSVPLTPEERRQKDRARMAAYRAGLQRGPKKGRIGVQTLSGEAKPAGWIGQQVLTLLAKKPMLARDMVSLIGVKKNKVETTMSFLLTKNQVKWRPTDEPYKPRLWSITQIGRDALGGGEA